MLTENINHFSLGSNPAQSSSLKRNDAVVDELNRRNSVISASAASNTSYHDNIDTTAKQSELKSRNSTSEFIPYGKAKNSSALTNESTNGMKGSPTVTSSR